MIDLTMMSKAKELVELCISKGLRITAAESCTGGLFMGAITSISGSSAVFDGGFVTYSNALKMAILDVEEETLDHDGAVSDACVRQMADGARTILDTDFAISISGIAGPDGGSKEKPVGLVYFGLSSPHHIMSYHEIFEGNRDDVRRQSVVKALDLLLTTIKAMT